MRINEITHLWGILWGCFFSEVSRRSISAHVGQLACKGRPRVLYDVLTEGKVT